VPNIITRRQFVATVAAGAVLATAQTTRAQSGFLHWMGRWNEQVDRVLFGSDRLAAELTPAETTLTETFPAIVQPVPSIHFSGCRLAVNLPDGWNSWCQKEQILYTKFMH